MAHRGNQQREIRDNTEMEKYMINEIITELFVCLIQ